jgi:sugar transferase (PEP-CTERM/EpsH1 system associated)
MKVLYLCHRIPYPPDKGDKIRAFHQIRAIASRHEVDLFTLMDDPADAVHRKPLAGYCHKITVSRLSPRLARLRALPSLLTSKPLTLPYFYSAELAVEVCDAFQACSYDRVFVYCSAMAQYAAPAWQVPTLLDMVDVDSDKWSQYAGFSKFPFSAIYRREARMLREYERMACSRFASILVTTEREAKLVRQISAAANVHAISNGVDTEYFSSQAVPPVPGPPAVIFTGDMSYFPNEEAVVSFARNVYPLLRRSIPDLHFFIVGRNPTPNVRQLGKIEGVEVTGFVSDVRTYLARAQVSVAPFSIAAGIQNKILEAMSYGLPVVATPRVAQGLSDGVARMVDIADDAQTMAAAVERLLRDPELACRKGAEGRQQVAADYNWDRSLRRVLQLLEDHADNDISVKQSVPHILADGMEIAPMTPSSMSNPLQQKPINEELRKHCILMLLTNAYEPDPRVRQEALALMGMGCHVQLLAWDRDLKAKPCECMEGVEVKRVFLASKHGRGSTQVFFYAWLYLKMFWKGWRAAFDVIHCHDLDTLPLGFLLGKLKRKPVVYDAHESFTDMLQDSVHPAVRRGLVRIENFLIRRIDLLITVGEKLRRHFVERGARHAVVVGNWKRLNEYSRTEQQSREVRRRLDIPDGALVIAYITNLLKDRKIEELLAAAADNPDTYVILGGKGVLEEIVVRAAARNPRVLFVGFVSGKDIADYTCAADAVYYGFDPKNPNARFSAPNKLYEALAAGRPLITGDFGEIAEVVRAGGCGIVLPEYNEAELRKAFALLRDPNARNQMAQNARQCGRTAMNWEKGEEILRREYSAMLPGLDTARKWDSTNAVAGVGN